MRTQEERDEQTLDIMVMVFGAALLLGLAGLVLLVASALLDA